MHILKNLNKIFFWTDYFIQDCQIRRKIEKLKKEDADFSKEAVDHSLEQARRFFETYYGEYVYDKFTCRSWLLSPALKPLLSASSHILSFQERFFLVQEDRQDREFIEWLFQVPAETAYK